MAIEDARDAASAVNLGLAGTRTHLSPEQQRQIARQLDFHEGAPFQDQVMLSRAVSLLVGRDVMRPMSSKALATWICDNPSVVNDRVVFDVGTGCGIQGIASAMAGARRVVASDVVPAAIECAATNIRRLDMHDLIEVRASDLFSGYADGEPADVLIFAQPFFGDEPIPERPISIGMLDPGRLVPGFLREAKRFLNPEGVLLMMAWPFAGKTNDPRTHCQEAGYVCLTVGEEKVSGGCQEGQMQILALHRVGTRESAPLVTVLAGVGGRRR